MRSRTIALACLLLPSILVACGRSTTSPSGTEIASSSSSSSEAVTVETHNVVYQGMVQINPVSVYMEGTHRLQLATGGFILLSSDTVDLNGYVGEEAEVTGSTRPTTEQGGTIMRVEKIRLLTVPSSSSSSSAELVSSVSSVTALASSVAAQKSSVSSAVTAAKNTSSAKSTVPPAVPPKVVSSSVSSVASAAAAVSGTVSESYGVNTKKMAKDNTAASYWTQSYCTEHIGFCVPIHKNWFFVSFGASANALWHVEASSAEIAAIGDGPIAINLVSGDIAASGTTDGAVLTSGDRVVGFRSWTGNQHFEISAPVSLKAAIQYMTANLKATVKQ